MLPIFKECNPEMPTVLGGRKHHLGKSFQKRTRFWGHFTFSETVICLITSGEPSAGDVGQQGGDG